MNIVLGGLVVMCGMVGGYVWDGWWLGKIGCFLEQRGYVTWGQTVPTLCGCKVRSFSCAFFKMVDCIVCG